MKLFLKYTGEFLRSYPQVRLNKVDEISIRDYTLSYLGLLNLNNLRDKFEGQAFFDKTMKNLGGLISCQRNLGISELELKKIDLNNYAPKLIFNDSMIDVQVFNFGTLPLIDIKKINKPVYFIIQKDSLTYILCGLASIKTIKDNLIESTIVNSKSNENMHFTGFEFLKSTKKMMLVE